MTARPVLRGTTLLLALVVALAPLGVAQAVGPRTNSEQLTAEDAVSAAIAWSRRTFADAGADDVLLGRNDRFPDNLASGAPQGSLDAPLLLNPSNALHADVSAELKRLGAKTVYLLGGTGAMSTSVEQALQAEGYTVRRLSGATRVETAIAVARELARTADTAIVSRAFGTPAGDESAAWADALGAGGWAASSGWPVLLTESERLSSSLEEYLRASSIKKVFVIGGTSAISSTTVNRIASLGIETERVSGPNRFDTAIRIAVRRGFVDASEAERVILAEGEDAAAWAGGFTAAAHSDRHGAPIVLANGTGLSPETEGWLAPGEEEVALWCGPFTSTEACDAAGAELDQAVTGVVTLTATSVPRDGSLAGKVAPMTDVSSAAVRGDCVETQAVTLNDDGEFSVPLRAAADATTCGIVFTVTHDDGRAVEQPFTLTLTAAPSVTAAPELVRVETVSPGSATASARLRFVFDERITAVDADTFAAGFSVVAPNSIRRATATSATVESGQTSVVVNFPVEGYELATLASVDANTVRNINVQGNPAASWALKSRSVAAGRTDGPDLVSVENFHASPTAGRVRVDFVFDMEDLSRSADAAEQFGLVLADGTVLESLGTPEVDDDTATAEFVTASSPSTLRSSTRRAYVTAGVVSGEMLGGQISNQYEVVDVASGGSTSDPDLASVELDTTADRVTYNFDDTIRTVGVELTPGSFTILSLTAAETAGTSIVSSAASPGSVTVQFPAGTVNEGVVAAQIREGAVSGFDAAAPDAVQIARSYAAGSNLGPRLVSVADEVTDVIGPQTRHRLTFTFDAPTRVQPNTAPEEEFFLHASNGTFATHETPCVELTATSVTCDFFLDDGVTAAVGSLNYHAVEDETLVAGGTRFRNHADYKRVTAA